jgi:hypothetical protein
MDVFVISPLFCFHWMKEGETTEEHTLAIWYDIALVEKSDIFILGCDLDYSKSQGMVWAYNIARMLGKKIFSLGPNFGHEEYWFYKNSCNLTFLDIDENKLIENYLQTLPSSISQNSLTYFIGDAFAYLRESYSKCELDVFYASSFAPDELRRGDIQARNSIFYEKAINHLSFKLFKKKLFKTWPKAAYP